MKAERILSEKMEHAKQNRTWKSLCSTKTQGLAFQDMVSRSATFYCTLTKVL